MTQTTKLPPASNDRRESQAERPSHALRQWALQLVRFGMVGALNTMLDLLVFNVFLWLLPTRDTTVLLIYNSIAYAVGGVNSFLLNKYWTFRQRQRTTVREVGRFLLVTAMGILGNDVLLWLAGKLLLPTLVADTRVWANVSKIIAITGTALISYLCMRLWVFINPAQHEKRLER